MNEPAKLSKWLSEVAEWADRAPIPLPRGLTHGDDFRKAAEYAEQLEAMTDVESGAKAVWRMRDEFLQLVAAYNAVGHYKSAADAQGIAIALDEFENKHVITEIEWPPRVIENEHGRELAEVES
jgi:hypothetical protein